MYKSLLIEDQVDLYCQNISDETFIGGEKWESLKGNVMQFANLEVENWFLGLTDYEKSLVRSLVFAQNELPMKDSPLKSTKDPLKVKEIEAKINVLFPEDSFYFYDATAENQIEEESEIKRLISDCMSAQKCYIKEGNLEPIHHQEGEREIIVD